jgi:hypothetical protein
MSVVSYVAAGLLLNGSVAGAQQPAAAPASQEDVARQLANPIANLVSLPLQFNWEQGVGQNEDLRFAWAPQHAVSLVPAGGTRLFSELQKLLDTGAPGQISSETRERRRETGQVAYRWSLACRYDHVARQRRAHRRIIERTQRPDPGSRTVGSGHHIS